MKTAIQALAGAVEAIEDSTNEYGTFYQAEGDLSGINGINGINLSVVTIRLERQIDGKFQFVTLKPRKEP